MENETFLNDDTKDIEYIYDETHKTQTHLFFEADTKSIE